MGLSMLYLVSEIVDYHNDVYYSQWFFDKSKALALYDKKLRYFSSIGLPEGLIKQELKFIELDKY